MARTVLAERINLQSAGLLRICFCGIFENADRSRHLVLFSG
jgi:hypothetical protein